ncbi:MAG TPA: hypothetical protein VFU48_04255 [Nitrospira sp.]|nr:hypothetical protein [Nitrospira sp.]
MVMARRAARFKERHQSALAKVMGEGGTLRHTLDSGTHLLWPSAEAFGSAGNPLKVLVSRTSADCRCERSQYLTAVSLIPEKLCKDAPRSSVGLRLTMP